MAPEKVIDRRYRWLIAAIVVLGLALRIASARGALWLDEAWSAQLAHDAATPLGVFLNINHDNNHHLNSLWLQAVGYGAPPMLARALSIVTSTITIMIASRVGARHSLVLGAVMAALFAVAPILVTMGSEARGYAPMLLAFVAAVDLTDRWLARDAQGDRHQTALTLCFLLGGLSQLTILFGFCAIAGWVILARRRRVGRWHALRDAAGFLLRPGLALVAVFAIVFGAAWLSPTGFQLGAYAPFSFDGLRVAVATMIGFTFGWPVLDQWWLLVAPLLVIFGLVIAVNRPALYVLAIIVFPVAVALLQIANVGHARYYLISAVGLLLLLAELIERGLVTPGPIRWLAAASLALTLVGSLREDADLIRNQRADPEAALHAMKMLAPAGATLLLDRPTGSAILEVAAAHDRYPLEIPDRTSCGAARFLFIDMFGHGALPPSQRRCGNTFRMIAQAHTRGLSGTDWALYDRQSRPANQ